MAEFNQRINRIMNDKVITSSSAYGGSRHKLFLTLA